MSAEEMKEALLALMGQPDVRAHLRRAVGTIEIDPAEILARIDENTAAIRRLQEETAENTAAIRRLQEETAENTAAIRRLQEETTALRSDFQEQMVEFRQQMTDFRQEMAAMRRDFQRGLDVIHRRLDGLGARWGILAEEAFREGMRAVLQDVLPGVSVRKWRRRDEEGRIYGQATWIEVDIAVEDGKTILVEVKSSASRGDVAALLRIARFYGEIEGKPPDRILLVSPFVDPHARSLADTVGVEIASSTGVIPIPEPS
ncbi:MAG: DUF3782 domain-containing protein [Planctomycetes bacterium]|nr:DUF3782 domain-containing protein [Planctomycetota bacterium]